MNGRQILVGRRQSKYQLRTAITLQFLIQFICSSVHSTGITEYLECAKPHTELRIRLTELSSWKVHWVAFYFVVFVVCLSLVGRLLQEQKHRLF